MTTPRRAARAAKAKAETPPVFDWRDPRYGVGLPGPDNPVTIADIVAARKRARADRQAWEGEHRPPPLDDDV
ncbi:hypothetical protein PV736_02180 [Streptomyces scabiei]|uniref:hypothetical protein n=1 Tax=Streptomyces scabiei TaxID=1930 RepID=UPI000765E9F4|nr:hypothetical protein [Streptomyces scabiei]MDX2657878.1 hypothetical protein [Streptomyces scabiei]MDX2724518.1 hypothetical protein [Streptomyces scabiei]MDX2869610.1 hypothetical protein [Streptomyces scabiei]MDX2887984.1 hypothetical protein [Streptomyces scabiei]MDX2891628.1 hypothetical protein [Streptomyces scabiei]